VISSGRKTTKKSPESEIAKTIILTCDVAAVISSGRKIWSRDSIIIVIAKKRSAQGHGKPLEPCESAVS